MSLHKLIKKNDGYAVAEFAVTIPALIGVLSTCIWAIGITINKYELENFSSNAARILARGESLPSSFIDSAPKGMTFSIMDSGSSIQVETKLIREIPLLNRQVELIGQAESVSEVYVE